MFKELVVVEPLVITKEGKESLHQYCEKLTVFDTTPQSDEETINRIGNADGILVSYSAKITKKVIEHCPKLKYIGMCCSCYSNTYSNVDLTVAKERRITVSALTNYGDEGTVEYIIAELLNLLHGLNGKQWKEKVYELNGIKVGIIGLGIIGGMTANALKYFGSDVYYYSRTKKPEFENRGITYLPLNELLQTVDVAVLSVNRDSIIMSEEAFHHFSNGKILINISLGTCYNVSALDNWLNDESNYYICDNASKSEKIPYIYKKNNVIYHNFHAGHSMQTDIRATKQIIDNIHNFIS